MSENYSRKCYPCSLQGESVPAGPNSKGVPNSARRRIDGVIRPVCERHAAAVKGARVAVAGAGHAERQAAEATMLQADASETARYLATAENLPAAERVAASYLTGEILARFERAARKGRSGAERDALSGEMLDAFLKRCAERVARFEPPHVDMITSGILTLNTSERRHALDVRTDWSAVDGGMIDAEEQTIGDLITEAPLLPEARAWRVAGVTIDADDFARLVRLHPAAAAAAGL